MNFWRPSPRAGLRTQGRPGPRPPPPPMSSLAGPPELPSPKKKKRKHKLENTTHSALLSLCPYPADGRPLIAMLFKKKGGGGGLGRGLIGVNAWLHLELPPSGTLSSVQLIIWRGAKVDSAPTGQASISREIGPRKISPRSMYMHARDIDWDFLNLILLSSINQFLSYAYKNYRSPLEETCAPCR